MKRLSSSRRRFGRRTRWLAIGAMVVLLVSALLWLMLRAQGRDSAGYFEQVALLRQLKQVDARWELDVLESRMELNANYDALVDPLAELHRAGGELNTLLHGGGPATPPAVAAAIEALHSAIDDKTLLIESFKSHNAVLRNSLAFLPTAADDVNDAIGRAGGRGEALPKGLSADAGRLLLSTLLYSHAPSQEKADSISAEMQRLAAQVAGGSPHIAEVLQLFSLHVRTVLNEQPAVNRLLDQIAAVPAAARIDDIDNLLSAGQQAALLRNQRDRIALTAIAAALAALLVYAAVALIRSHAVIQRVNDELLGANATLEARVRERSAELQATQNELVETARHAGMAEIANNVLHNVGNVLNSVNVSAALVAAGLRESKGQGLARAVDLLDANAATLARFVTEDARGKLLPDYLRRVSGAMAEERDVLLREIDSLTRSVDHIKDIVAAQQTYAGAASLVQPVRIGEVLDDALRMDTGGLSRHGVTVVKQVAELPLLMLDRPRLLQILVNLIANARQAMDGVCDRARRITLGVAVAESAKGRRLHIRVQDAGIGIRPENLARIFTHGFTTRKDGHGFGLHSCVLAATEMGGSLTAHSAGPGHGATFTIDLPMNYPPRGGE